MGEKTMRVLIGWKEIAAYLNCSPSSAIRRAREGLPVFRVGGSVRAFTADIDRWLEGERLRKIEAETAPAETPGLIVDGTNLTEALATLDRATAGRRYAVIPLGVDTSEYAKIEGRLGEAEAKYRWLVETVPAWIWEMDAEGVLTYSNVAAVDVLGYRPEEVVGYEAGEYLLSPEDVGAFDRAVGKVRREKAPARDLQYRFLHRDGSSRWLETDAEPAFDAAGRFVGIRAVSRDITERKRAEEKERELIRNLSFLSEAAMGFVEMAPAADPFLYVGEKLRTLAGDAVITVASYDAAGDAFTVRNVWASGANAESFIGALGFDAAGLQVRTPATIKKRLFTGRFQKLSATLDDIAGDLIPRKTARRLPRELGIRGIYAAGITTHGRLLGAIGLVIFGPAVFGKRDVIEAFLDQAAVALERKTAEEALRRREEEYHSLADNIPVGVYRTEPGPEGRILSANPAAVRIFGFTRADELVQTRVVDLYADPSARAEFVATIAPLGAVEDYEVRLRRRDGREFWASVSARAVRGADGGIAYIDGIVEDVTARKEIQERVKAHNEFLRDVLASLTHPFYVIEVGTYEVLLTNPATDEYGFREGITCHELSHRSSRPCDSRECRCPLDEVVRSRKPFTVEHVHYDAAGTARYVEVHAYPIVEPDGAVNRIIEYNLDITARREAEKARAETEARLSAVVSRAPIALYVYDRAGTVTLSAGRGCYATGFGPGELVGVNVFERFGDDASLSRPLRRALAGEDVEEVITTSRDRRFDTTYTPLRDDDGEVVGAIAVGTDVTERERARAAREESEAQFRTLAEESPNVIFINQRGRIVYANEKSVALMGYAKNELYDPDFDFVTLVAPEHWATVKKAFAAHDRGEEVEPYEYKLVAKDKTKISALISTKLIRYEGDAAILGVVTDVTRLKRAEERAAAVGAQLRAVLDDIGEGVSFVDAAETIVFASRVLAEALGYKPAGLAGKPLRELAAPEEYAKFEAETAKRREGRSSVYATALRHKTGALVPFTLSCRPLFDDSGEFLGTVGIIVAADARR